MRNRQGLSQLSGMRDESRDCYGKDKQPSSEGNISESAQTWNVVYNERIKLFATFLNGIGVAVFAVGGLAPLIATFNGASNHSRLLLFTSSLCILGAFALHSLASAILTRMRT